ncbi:MAG: hypothetical protein LBG69_04245 [Zoogloeaceae bacterium]|nr:hypothetical protein [Zoogloeaceae bacterium]
MISALHASLDWSRFATSAGQSARAVITEKSAANDESENATSAFPPETEKAEETTDASGRKQAIDKSASDEALSEDERREVEELKKTDRAVRQHEQQHLAASGGLAKGGASYTYQTGPDGQKYATGGEVQIDASAGKTPEETLSRARRIRAAALAPADPSPQDRSVAAMASQMEMEAMRAIAQQEMTDGTAKKERANVAEDTGASAPHASGKYSESFAAEAYKQASHPFSPTGSGAFAPGNPAESVSIFA